MSRRSGWRYRPRISVATIVIQCGTGPQSSTTSSETLSLLFDVILTDAIPTFHDYILKQGDLQMIFVLRRWLIHSVFVWSILGAAGPPGFAQSSVRDPGVRPVVNWNRIGGWPSNACPNNLVVPVPGLTSSEQKIFARVQMSLPRRTKSRRTV